MKVSDVLGFSAMQQAKVLVGQDKLQKIVTTISVLEVSDPTVYRDISSSDEYAGGELLLTSFAQVKEDVSKQCQMVCLLHQQDQLGLIIYYVGLILPDISAELIELMEELGMILICMPKKNANLRYSELLSETLFFLHREMDTGKKTKKELLQTIRQLPKNKQKLEVVLQMISDQVKGTVLLTNESNQLVTKVSWPRNAVLPISEYLQHYFPDTTQFVTQIQNHSYDSYNFYSGNKTFQLEKSKNSYTVHLLKTEAFTIDILVQIKEAIQFSLTLFGETQLNNKEEFFIQALIEQDLQRAHYFAQLLQLPLFKKMQLSFIICQSALTQQQQMAYLKDYIMLQDPHCVVGNYQEIFVCIHEFRLSFEQLIENADDIQIKTILLFKNMPDFSSISHCFSLYKHCKPYLATAYPRKKIIEHADLQILEEVIENGTQKDGFLLLDSLKGIVSDKELLETFATYVIDANENLQLTGDYLFLHKNTVKYRLAKIKNKLDDNLEELSNKILFFKALLDYRLNGKK